MTLTVTPPADFTLTASPSTQTVKRNSTGTYSVSIAPSGGFSGTVTLGITVAPGGPTATLSPTSLSSGTSVLTVKSGIKLGTFALTVTATSGALTHTTTVSLIVTK